MHVPFHVQSFCVFRCGNQLAWPQLQSIDFQWLALLTAIPNVQNRLDMQMLMGTSNKWPRFYVEAY